MGAVLLAAIAAHAANTAITCPVLCCVTSPCLMGTGAGNTPKLPQKTKKAPKRLICLGSWWGLRDSNPRPKD